MREWVGYKETNKYNLTQNTMLYFIIQWKHV
jgi:hypothetical protein